MILNVSIKIQGSEYVVIFILNLKVCWTPTHTPPPEPSAKTKAPPPPPPPPLNEKISLLLNNKLARDVRNLYRKTKVPMV